jgi:hypothetical protein
MDATMTIPGAPKVPHDLAALLSYQAPQNRTQLRRVAVSAALADGVSLDGNTLTDEL